MLLFIIFFVIVLIFIFARLSLGISKSSACLVGKSALITGANSGLGYQTALNLASRGCRIIMADVADMEQSKLDIIKYSQNPNIIAKRLDLKSLKSVREFASDILENFDKLDILINNAGISACRVRKTEDRLHPVMQVNYFGHFLLTHLLIDLLKKSAPSRIIFTSSLFSFFHNLTPENLNSNKISKQFLTVYCNSKLALLLASDVFAEKLNGTGVTSNSVHPGFVRTQIFKSVDKISLGVKIWMRVMQILFAKDSWEGAQSIVHVAVSRKLEKISGRFFVDCRPFRKPAVAYDGEFCRKIWEATEEYIGLKVNEKTRNTVI